MDKKILSASILIFSLTIFATFVFAAAPVLTITGFTADGNKMLEMGSGEYVLYTDGVASHEYLIQFLTGSQTDQIIPAGYYSLKLISSTVPAATLKAYYDARGVPEPFLTYLKGAADGINAYAFIKTDGVTRNVQLVDGARHSLLGSDSAMAIPGDYPHGTYTVSGTIQNQAGESTTVTFKLIISEVPPVPTMSPLIMGLLLASLTTIGTICVKRIRN